MKKKYNDRIKEVIKRKAEERREQEHIKFSKDYQPEVEGYKPERSL